MCYVCYACYSLKCIFVCAKKIPNNGLLLFYAVELQQVLDFLLIPEFLAKNGFVVEV